MLNQQGRLQFCGSKILLQEACRKKDIVIVSKCLQDESDLIGCTKISTDGRAEACFAHLKLLCL